MAMNTYIKYNEDGKFVDIRTDSVKPAKVDIYSVKEDDEPITATLTIGYPAGVNEQDSLIYYPVSVSLDKALPEGFDYINWRAVSEAEEYDYSYGSISIGDDDGGVSQVYAKKTTKKIEISTNLSDGNIIIKLPAEGKSVTKKIKLV